MKTGYDQFFKAARKNAEQGAHVSFSQRAKTHLNSRLHERRRTLQKRKRSSQWRVAVMCAGGALLAALGLSRLDQIENFLNRIEIEFLGQAQAQATNPATEKSSKAESKDGKENSEAKSEPARVAYKPEEIDHFRKLNERKKELDAREEELNRMEQELLSQKADLEKRLESLDQTRRTISTMLEARVKVDEQKVDTLVQMYSSMKPQQAAQVFEKMDEDLAVEILGRMKKKNAAEIMNLIKAEKAQILSEKYAGYSRRYPATNNKQKEGGSN